MQKKESVLRVIKETVRKHGVLSAALLGVVCGAVIFALLPPLVLAQLIDLLTKKHTLWMEGILLYFGLLALTGLLESARESLLTVFGQKITHALRSSLMEKFGRLSANELNRQEPGALVSRFVGDVDTVNKEEPGAVVSRFVGDVDTVEALFTSGIISMFADACKILSILAVIWVTNRGLTIVLIILLPVLFLFTRYIQKNMLTSQIANRRAVSRASGHVPETLHNIRTIHCLQKETYMEQQYAHYIDDSYSAMEKTNFYDAVYSPVILILNAIVVAVVMLLSASGNSTVLKLFGMSAGTAVAVINYISQIFAPVESLGMEIQTIQSAFAGMERINEFYSLEEKKEPAALTENTDYGIAAELKNVTFGYDESQVILNDVSLQIKKGEQVTLLGRTGAGKSTIFKLLLGLYEPQKGMVLIWGVPSVDLPDAKKRKVFGYVEQSFHMVPGSVKDQITLYDAKISDTDVKKAAELTGLAKTIEALPDQYDTICTQDLFSQGQWQLLSIARAAAAEPEILLLDEITANLDAETEKMVLNALQRVSKNRTVISISHRTMAETGRVIPIS